MTFRELNLNNIILTGIKDSLLEVLYNSYHSKNATKSSKRTDSLHETFKKLIKDVVEPSILNKRNIKITTDINKSNTGIEDGYGKNISCDLIIQEGDKIEDILMLKAPMTSLNKNFHNSINNVHGEAIRILLPEKNHNLNIYSINFIPKKAPVLKNDKEIIYNWETVRIFDKENYNLKPFGILENQFNYINIYYDLNEKIYESKTIYEVFDKIKELMLSQEEIIKIESKDFKEIEDFFKTMQSKYNRLLNDK